MNFKNITFGLAAAATAFVAPAPAQAGFVVEGIPFMDQADFPARAHGVVTALYEAGVPIVDGGKAQIDDCKPQEEGVLFGYYDFHDNYMVLCTNNMNETEMVQTLVHEAVHTVQDCRTGIASKSIAVGEGTANLWAGLSAQHKEEIQKFYEPEQHLEEIEARHFENNPQAVEQGLRTFCF